MTFGERLYQLRKQKYISQDELADIMEVSRQSISKWELDQTYPDIDNIVKLAKYFDVSVDYLVTGEEKISKDISQDETIKDTNSQNNNYFSPIAWHYEYKSKKTVNGVPLVHINLGLGLYRAKGIIAIGNIASGIIAIGGLSFGILSIGGLCIGLLASGGLAIGLILALGGVAISALFAVGGISVGSYALGGIAVGFYKAIGGIAIAKHPLGALNFYLTTKSVDSPLLKIL